MTKMMCPRQTGFDQRAEKWVTTYGGWRWPLNRALRGIGSGHSNFGTWSNFLRRQQLAADMNREISFWRTRVGPS